MSEKQQLYNSERANEEQRTYDDVSKERREAFKKKYLAMLRRYYEATLATFSQKVPKDKEGKLTSEPSVREMKTKAITQAYQNIAHRLSFTTNFTFGDIQKAILKLKLARHFQNNDTVDISTLYDAFIESPRFLNDDKGSIHRLFQVHEEKTLLKIAEIRKARAEMTGEEGLNPFEWVYETQDGEYALARLINMPHLEEESTFMKHCVGTSDSYISKMKRGEIEIFSVRTAPKIDERTGKLTEDKPVLTIEYNVKTGVIEQMKKYDDEYLQPSDPYYEDVVEILKHLKYTQLDTGKRRTVRSIARSETQHFSNPKAGHILTDHGEISWEEFDPKSDLLVLKTSRVETNATTPKEILVKMLTVFQGVEVEPHEIARTVSEVDETTRVYVGLLQLGFFQKLPDTVEHTFTSPDRKEILRQTKAVGGRDFTSYIEELEINGLSDFRDHNNMKKRLESIDASGVILSKEARAFVEQLVNAKIVFSDEAVQMMKDEDFQKSLRIEDEKEKDWTKWKIKPVENMDFISLSVADLNIQGIGTRHSVCARAQEFGLELVPPGASLSYRLTTLDQDYDRLTNIGMKQITVSDGKQYAFILGASTDHLWLGEDWKNSSSEFASDEVFIFHLRKSKI